MPLGLIGKKLGHTRVYDAKGVVVPVTVVLAGPNRVLQVKTKDSDGYSAVQLAFGPQKPQRLARPVLGHLVKFGAASKDDLGKSREVGTKPSLPSAAKIREFRDFSQDVKTGDVLGPTLFAPGDFVDAIGVTKGQGFEGVVKRHKFAGGDSTHGAKGWHRRSGAIGNRLFPGTVMRGMKMPGHMGQRRRTTQNLEIIQVREEDNLLLIKGSLPGAEGDYVILREAKKMPVALARKRAEEARVAEEAKEKARIAKAAKATKTAKK
jgi:large subunit ribosomal protein L3